MTADRVVFWFRGSLVEVADVPATTTVLEWLRGEGGSKGTKEGCNEGDCGACTVAIGDRVGDGSGALRLSTANACLMFLPMLHGRALFTIEDLVPLQGGSLHPAQRAMIGESGSQCGFCTPGVVMSLWCMFERRGAQEDVPTRQELADGLAGNLCRCTGYRSILDAGERMFGQGSSVLDVAPIVDALRKVDDAMVLEYRSQGTELWAPTTITDLGRLLEEHPDARVVAGATDVALAVTQQLQALPRLIWTGRVKELQSIEQVDQDLRIGAGARLEDAWAALEARAPGLEEFRLRFASPAIRQMGTMGGNIVNGSPIGDATPVLLVLDAVLEIQGAGTRRQVPLSAFALDEDLSGLRPGEFLSAIVVPDSAFRRDVRAFKISRRFDSDISAVSGAFALDLEEGLVREVRLAFGGMAANVHRALRAEAAMRGRPWDESTLRAAQAALEEDFTPISDHRASAHYRAQAARALLERLWWQTRIIDPVRPEATGVWTRSGATAGGVLP